MNQVRSEASSSGSNNSNVSTPVAKDFTSHRILYPISETPPEGNRVKWIGLHPLEMVDQIMSMANHSANARSATHSIDEVFMKRVASTTPTAIAVLPSSTKEKNEMFQTKMSNWLLQNWTNPFPDTAALNFLANHLLQAQCIVVKANDAHVLAGKSFEERQRYMMKKACKKIETYLVNSRLRKWRKSIEDAFDLRRPAYLLLEDSLRLCEGKALRPIEGWNSHVLFASHARYSLPLNTWKRKKVVKKRSAKGTVAAKAGAWHLTPKRQRCASPKELSAGDGLIELAKGLKVMSTCERKSSPSDVVVKVGGMGLSPFNIGIGPALEEDAPTR